MPKISIITVNLNNAVGLDKTIASIVDQFYKEFEYIIIDGASTDGSVDIIKKYSNKITYWISEPDKGIYNAMNKGIKKASGEYCIFINSGDTLSDDQVLSRFIEGDNDCDICYGNCAFKTQKGLRVQEFPTKLTFYWMFTEYLSHPSTFIKMQLFDRIGKYNEELKISSDWEFFLLAIGKHNASVCHLNAVIAVIEEGGISSSPRFSSLVKEEREQIMLKHFPFFFTDYQALYHYYENSFFLRTKRMIKKSIGWKRTY